jgi:uncharacterized metal-binding protein YceD (DUF177 family)
MFKIFVEQLKDGRKEKIDFTVDPEFLDLHEAEIALPSPVKIEGEAYVTDAELILHLNVETTAIVPCAVCNKPTSIPLAAKEVYFTTPLDTLPSAIYDYTDVIRDELVLLIPQFVECGGENQCPGRADLKKYSKKPDDASSPFANLSLPEQ